MKVLIMQLYASSVMFSNIVSSFSFYALRNWAAHLERGPQIHKYKEVRKTGIYFNNSFI